ncbi:MAG TPA: cyclic nucleotide-binding and patatin-like phospholipase domain-containing protein [Acidimicrobiia bacterium]|nr:cyclic nucleotide-binding and patatin-like phospholipase domain-containing protein [Acidimicrobiia bacterium]
MAGTDLLELLSGTETFTDVDEDLLRGMLEQGKLVSAAAGTNLARQGSKAGQAYVLLEGTLEVRHRIPGGEVTITTLAAPGSVVGEVAIIAGGRRNASLHAVDDVTALAVPRRIFEEVLDQAPSLTARLAQEALRRMEETALRSFLARTFGTDDEDLQRELLELVEWRRYVGGEVVLREGAPADAAYVVVSGRLLVTKEGLDGQAERLAEIARGEIVGELGFLDGGYRHATVTAMRDTVLVRVPLELFDTLIERRPHQMIEAARRIVRRALRPTRPRATGLVLSLGAVDGVDGSDLCRRLVEVMDRFGSTQHLWPQRVDEMINRPGAANAPSGDPSEVRLATLLQEQELSNAFLLLELDRPDDPWARRAVRQSDRVVMVAPAHHSVGQIDRIKRTFDLATTSAEKVLVLVHRSGTLSPAGCSGLVTSTGADQVINIREGLVADLERLARILTGHGYGLVLGGGGARGFAHIGVYRALNELGIPIDLVGGTSIGAVFAAIIARDVSPQEIATMTPPLFRGVLDYTIPVVSLVKGERITKNLNAVFGGMEIEDLWRGFFCVSTNLTRSRPLVHRSGPLAAAVRASLAIPGVIPPVPHGEDLLVDGGVLDNVPTGVMRRLLPGGTVVAVELAPPLGPRAKSDFGLSVSGWQALLSKARGRKAVAYPGATAVLLRSMITGSYAQRDQKVEDSDLYLDLDLRGIGMLDFETVQPVVKAGYEAAMPRLEAWLAEQRDG